ncbi:MAG TPA: hypothetical protein VH880_03890 [Anaeromyxobacteraceae bacterium]|jgi:hypothetical protein
MTRIARHLLALGVALAAAACGSTASWPAPAGQTSAMAAAAVGGRLKLYVPIQPASGNATIAVLDGGLPAGGAARIATIDLGTTDFASLVAGDEGGIVAASVTFPRIWFIDPVADRVTKTLTLDASYGLWDFSDRTGYVTGVIVDSGRRRAWAGVWNGFAVLDLDRQEVVERIVTAPSESFGYDPVRGLLLAPFYLCDRTLAINPGLADPPPCDSFLAPDGVTVVTDGLNAIDVRTGAVFTFQDAAAANPAQPLGPVPDSCAVDRISGGALVAAEGANAHVVVELAAASFDPEAGTFSAPARQVAVSATTGVALVPDGSYGVAGAEFANAMGVYDRGPGTLLPGALPDRPDGHAWLNGGDPHVVFATTWNGRALGFVLASDHDWVARVDLAAFRALPHAGAALTPVETAPAVTFLDARVP